MTLSKQQFDEDGTGRTDTENEYAHGAQAYHSSFARACKTHPDDVYSCGGGLHADVSMRRCKGTVSGSAG
jgi:hypothetical protein